MNKTFEDLEARGEALKERCTHKKQRDGQLDALWRLQFEAIPLSDDLLAYCKASEQRNAELVGALRLAETEMRYAGWDKRNTEQVGREPAYKAVKKGIRNV